MEVKNINNGLSNNLIDSLIITVTQPLVSFESYATIATQEGSTYVLSMIYVCHFNSWTAKCLADCLFYCFCRSTYLPAVNDWETTFFRVNIHMK